MALAIRMARGGRRNLPFYRIVVADVRAPRDGRYVEKLGTYNPLLENGNDNRVVLNKERIEYWLGQGAKPSDRVARFLGQAGIIPAPKYNETPSKSAPKAKAQERLKEQAQKAEDAAEAAREAAEAAKAPKEEPVVEAAAEEAAAPEETTEA